MIHYHGTPITPREHLLALAGRHFCVSYARADDVVVCHQIGQSVLLDNGAFSLWKGSDWRRRDKQSGGDGFYRWVEPWLDYPTDWAIIPDAVGGDEDVNDRLLDEWRARRLPRGAPVWHLHESLDRLRQLVASYERVCFGSSGAYATPGSDAWHRRVSEAFDALMGERGQVPWVHMLRGMNYCDVYPFASADSTDIARNHVRPQNTSRRMADRWDAMQPSPRWQRRGKQLDLDQEVLA